MVGFADAMVEVDLHLTRMNELSRTLWRKGRLHEDIEYVARILVTNRMQVCG